MIFEISSVAAVKAILHSLKYPAYTINGLFIGT